MIQSHSTALLKQIDSFPALPATVNKVMAVTGNPESSAHDLMKAILPDQSMCTAILKIANSAFFGLPGQVSTIEKAIIVLGFEEVRNVVIGKAVFASFQKLNKSNRHNIQMFWEHSFTCGLAAKILATHLGYSQSELFIAGLIHDIGKLAMLMTFPHDYSPLLELSEPHQFQSIIKENEIFSISHDEIGMRLLKRWHFPEALTMAIGYHHRPQLAPTHMIFPLIVQMADILSLIYCSPEKLSGDDVQAIFRDFLPENMQMWKDNNLPCDLEKTGLWYEQLTESRKRDGAVLDIFTSA
jgi:putative nucleotidyltransferase with HDIG domain